jgi:tetratricopeptide (TPR) repeat protein
VFWVDVGSPSTAKNGFLAIAKAIGSVAESVEESLQALANAKKRWLLILDNADDPRFDYARYLPSGTQGAVLITSRIPQCAQYSTIPAEALEGLGVEHSTQLFLKAAQVPEGSWHSRNTQAQEIVQLLGVHTLALIQAGAYIAEGYCRVDQYTDRYQRQRKRLLNHFPEQEQSRYRDVYATFEASADVLRFSSGDAEQDALDLLAILSMLHSSVLPLQLFADTWTGAQRVLVVRSAETAEMDTFGRWHVSQLPNFIDSQAEEWDDYRLKKASALLASLSLVTRNRLDDLDGLSMHPLAHAWAKDRLRSEQQQAAWVRAGCILALSRGESETWQVYERQLRPHVQSFLSPSVEAMFLFGPLGTMLPILLECGWALNTMREDSRLESLLHGIYRVLQITPSDPLQEHIRIWDLAAKNSLDVGHTREAVGLLECVVKFRASTLDETHIDLRATQHNLAIAYRRYGQIKKAVVLLKHIVNVNKASLEETDNILLTSQHQLAVTYRHDGQTGKAVTLLEHVVKVKETTLAETHPDRLASQHGLARAYEANGQIEDAVALLEHVVAVESRVLQDDHPSRIVSIEALQVMYLQLATSKRGV